MAVRDELRDQRELVKRARALIASSRREREEDARIVHKSLEAVERSRGLLARLRVMRTRPDTGGGRRRRKLGT
jgi:hypothetical protein